MSKGNKKLSKDTLTLSLPAGKTCLGANECKAFVEVNKDNKRTLKRGDECVFTCFAASEELRYPNVFNSRKYKSHKRSYRDQFIFLTVFKWF